MINLLLRTDVEILFLAVILATTTDTEFQKLFGILAFVPRVKRRLTFFIKVDLVPKIYPCGTPTTISV